MAKPLSVLVDTDIFIDYFNCQIFREFFESDQFRVYYSVVTKKELLSKEGINRTEEKAIRRFLKKVRLVLLDLPILEKYSLFRKQYPQIAKEDCLIAATAVVKNFYLVTRNFRHFRVFKELNLYFDHRRA